MIFFSFQLYYWFNHLILILRTIFLLLITQSVLVDHLPYSSAVKDTTNIMSSMCSFLLWVYSDIRVERSTNNSTNPLHNSYLTYLTHHTFYTDKSVHIQFKFSLSLAISKALQTQKTMKETQLYTADLSKMSQHGSLDYGVWIPSLWEVWQPTPTEPSLARPCPAQPDPALPNTGLNTPV